MSKQKQSKDREAEPHWKYVERVVELLEQAIAPGARVEYDGHLLDYEAGIMRQCDVVIRQGEPPRETLTMVEVQDRNRRVTITTFEGWYRKREKLRAQHLICVSQKGFSRSVVQEVRRLGNTVRLVHLKELEETAWPVKFKDGKLPLLWPEIEIDSFIVKTVDNKMPATQFKREDVEFERNGQPIQLGQLFDEYFQTIGIPPNGVDGVANQRIEFGKDDVLIMSWAGDSARVDAITRRVNVKVGRTELLMSASEYQQIDFDGVLAWQITGTGEKDGREVALRLVFTPLPDGLLKLAAVQSIGGFNKDEVASINFVVNGRLITAS